MKVLLVLYLCVCVYVCSADDTVPPAQNKCKESGNELEKTCELDTASIQAEGEYECSCDFHVEEGYKIEVVVEKINLDGSRQDSVSIGTDDAPDEYMFTWFVEKEKRILLLGQSAHVHFRTNSFKSTTGENDKEFIVRMKRYGQLTTTMEPPTTPIEWPEPAENDTIFYTVNVTANPHSFPKKIETFRTLMAASAQKYCEENKIALVKNVTEQNVLIDLAVTCPVAWPNYETCIQIRFAIPVFLENGTIPAYQLQLVHLQRIWQEFVGAKLSKLDWTVYEEPKSIGTMLIWLGVSLGFLAIFMVFLLVIRQVGFLLKNRTSDRRPSDTKNIMDNQARASDTSLFPTTQVVPPLFESNVCSYYEPDFNISMRPPQIHNPSSTSRMIDVDDLSDEDVMDVNNIRFDRSSNHNSIILDSPHTYESAL